MGSRFLTKREAAQVLGCHVRTVFEKIRRGELRPVPNGKRVDVLEEDVIALRDSKRKFDGERSLPFAINRQTIHRLDTEIRVLRQELNQVLRVMNIRRDPLKVSDLEIVSLYKTAVQYVAEGWPPQVEEAWATYFLRLSIDNFKQLERMTEDHHPWRPFLKLVNTMVLQPYNTELTIQLSSGRDNLQSMASVWFEVKRISPRRLDAMLVKDSRPNKRLLGILERRQAKYAAKN